MSKRILILSALAVTVGCSDSPDSQGADAGSTEDVINLVEDAGTPEDDVSVATPDVDVPTEPTFSIDLRADTNRDGIIDFEDPSDDDGEDEWTVDQGAIFLGNIDDDLDACPANVTDDRLAACFDGADDIVNGPDDLLDMAKLELRLDQVPDGETVLIEVENADRVRMFRPDGDSFVVVESGTEFSTEDLSLIHI